MHTIIYCGKVEIMHLTLGEGERMEEKLGKKQCVKNWEKTQTNQIVKKLNKEVRYEVNIF